MQTEKLGQNLNLQKEIPGPIQRSLFLMDLKNRYKCICKVIDKLLKHTRDINR